jgi:hypothetical protein
MALSMQKYKKYIYKWGKWCGMVMVAGGSHLAQMGDLIWVCKNGWTNRECTFFDDSLLSIQIQL